MTSRDAPFSSPAAHAGLASPPDAHSAVSALTSLSPTSGAARTTRRCTARLRPPAQRAPHLVQADAAHEDDVRDVLRCIRERHERLDVLVSNVAFGPTVAGVDDYSKRGLLTAIDYSAWPHRLAHSSGARSLRPRSALCDRRVGRGARHDACRLRPDGRSQSRPRDAVPLPALPASRRRHERQRRPHTVCRHRRR